jgi:hypothetical protein
MRDDERIEMYYKFGLLDWKNEQKLQKTQNNIKADSIDLRQILVGLWARIIRRYRNFKIQN